MIKVNTKDDLNETSVFLNVNQIVWMGIKSDEHGHMLEIETTKLYAVVSSNDIDELNELSGKIAHFVGRFIEVYVSDTE